MTAETAPTAPPYLLASVLYALRRAPEGLTIGMLVRGLEEPEPVVRLALRDLEAARLIDHSGWGTAMTRWHLRADSPPPRGPR